MGYIDLRLLAETCGCDMVASAISVVTHRYGKRVVYGMFYEIIQGGNFTIRLYYQNAGVIYLVDDRRNTFIVI